MRNIEFIQFLVILGISLFVSMFISYLYLTFFRNRATGSQIQRSFPLIGVSVTTIFICIQVSLPLSLGLLGALSIVRFRTPIKEPEEIGFILLVIAASICCATFNYMFLGVLLAISAFGLVVLNYGPRFLKRQINDGLFLITVPSDQFKSKNEAIVDYLESICPKGKVESIIEKHDITTLSYSFIQIEKRDILKLQRELEQIAEGAKSNILFNRIGDV